ncbi:putative bifunctional diguanylate cyclase/phosphodiesterase [Tepidibacter formicigenes]|jgi:diguanylate cyclase (GGDEF)-like protein|uniref:Diguanylate cyclase (GGDEF) domain-containing protein n=1 Tax=Tepidibacter formicigenes DSM 15518 TaxID=1123349 RepID=A0A1M6N5E7_9FIRM|nr:EAL domain-containing protein [Tepidibacter formicigenes]SHJ90927.1 diguanylate cyclase (GGDEF) domain-containing protein [Tepidibacter formicigenes DSM 15518]
MNKRHYKNISGLFFLMLLFLATIIISSKNSLPINIFDFVVEGVCFIFAVICIFLSIDLKIRYLSIGWIIFSISLLTDSIDELKFISIPEWIDTLFEKIFLVLGVIFIAYGFYKAIREKEKLLKKLKYVAYNDPLTNLPNRRVIENNLNSTINKALKNNSKVGILFIDLDKFKFINDSLGHSAGDYVLKEVASRLRKIIKKDDYIARLGGDEFIIILSDINDKDEIVHISRKILDNFEKPFILKEKSIHITCSIGISIFPENGKNIEELMKNADIAMYKTKEKEGNSYQFYDCKMNNQIEKKFDIAESLRVGLEKREFILHYQPKVDIKTDKVIGLEALVRWNHPEKGLIYPNNFISVAEETGLIKKLDEYILELACIQVKEWEDKGLDPVNISVNISPKLLNESNFVEKVESILINTKIDPSLISIEITETAAMRDKEYAYKVLGQLRLKGIRILLDDFGKGYSSLSYLKDFPIDVLKIDKSFVDEICSNNINSAIMRAIIDMAKALNLKVLAEGVETQEQLKLLNDFNCEEYQGYLFSKPVPVKEIEDMLKERYKKAVNA